MTVAPEQGKLEIAYTISALITIMKSTLVQAARQIGRGPLAKSSR